MPARLRACWHKTSCQTDKHRTNSFTKLSESEAVTLSSELIYGHGQVNGHVLVTACELM